MNLTRPYILFDLDGTLTDSAPGILHSIRLALERLGVPEPDEPALRRFLGPPLRDAFRGIGLGEDDAARAVALYREYFSVSGLFENDVYPGVPALLGRLRAAGKTLCVATSKPEVYTNRILAHYDLGKYFEIVVGSELGGARSEKADVVRHVLQLGGIVPDDAVMVGDRDYDVVGAHACGVPAVGVLYGYGSLVELEAAGADGVAATPPELCRMLLGEGR